MKKDPTKTVKKDSPVIDQLLQEIVEVDEACDKLLDDRAKLNADLVRINEDIDRFLENIDNMQNTFKKMRSISEYVELFGSLGINQNCMRELYENWQES